MIWLDSFGFPVMYVLVMLSWWTRSQTCWMVARIVEKQAEWATLAVTAASRVRPHRDCCTPAILAYSESYSNSIYHSNPFRSLSHIFPAERQLHKESLWGVSGSWSCEVWVLLGVWGGKNANLYVSGEFTEEVVFRSQFRRGSRYRIALDIQLYLQKH